MPQQYLVSTPTTTTATGRTASSAKRLRYDHSPNRRRAIRTPSGGGTGSVDCSTSTSRSPDVCDVSGTPQARTMSSTTEPNWFFSRSDIDDIGRTRISTKSNPLPRRRPVELTESQRKAVSTCPNYRSAPSSSSGYTPVDQDKA